jgi:dTDP-4-amino-4,6-dideoxygalactose transaminase
MVGSSGRLTSFSFYATKNLTTGEGGMLTGAPELIEKARVLSLHGMSANAWNRYAAGAPWYYEVVAPGYKYNMSDVQAAIGSAQLQKLDTMQRRRREIVDRYSEVLGDMPELELPRARGHVSPAWHLYPVRVAPDLVRGGRDGFIERMTALNIGTSVHFIPLHLHPFYREKYGLLQQDYPVAQAAFERLVSLPLHPGLADSDIDDVAQAVRLAARGG